MFRISLRFSKSRTIRFCSAMLMIVMFAAASVYAQRQRAQEEDRPLFVDFRGVRLGMAADEARKKLGSPRDKGDDVDLYVFNDNEAVQIYYDKAKMVSAISIDFMSGASDVPAPKDIVGSQPEVRADGSAYKMVRYPKAGYWVSYSKTAGNSPTITVTMQKIQ